MQQLKTRQYCNRLAMADNAPVDRGSKEATFTALANDFRFDDRVTFLFLNGPMETLEDFRFYFTEEKEIDAFVAMESSLKGPDQRIQIARVRRAWSTIRQNGARKQSRNIAESAVELDDLLEEGSLRVVKVQFWKRYKMMYPVEVSPSDQLLSRCYREMDMRRLTVYDIWKVKTLQQQVMTKNEERGRHRSTHGQGRAGAVIRGPWRGKIPGSAPNLPFGIINCWLKQSAGSPAGRGIRERRHQIREGSLGCVAIVRFSGFSHRHASAGGIPAGMVGRKGHHRKSSMGIPVSRGK